MSLPRRLLLVLVLLGTSVGCDQATKQLATSTLADGPGYSWLGDTVRLRYAENSGAFLSLGARLPEGLRFGLLTGGVGLILLGIALYLVLGRKLVASQVAGLAFVLGGGFSNWLDRATNDGRVVDFMNLGVGSLRTGIFNVADLAILAGIGLLFLHGWREPAAPSAAPPPADPAT